MGDEEAARALGALGHPARLVIFRLLVRAEPGGLNIGEIGRHLGMAASTLAHHLGALVEAGLVVQERKGREVVNHADVEAVKAVTEFILTDCCQGVDIDG